jgi:molybdopterin/thiamine biosynthesis adenylyltransferase
MTRSTATSTRPLRSDTLPAQPAFEYNEAFSRNVGWLTAEEQEVLRQKRVAIAGLGGAGGHYLLTLARLGVEKFSLAEFDNFEVANFNRQVGSALSSVGHPKLDVMRRMAQDINPQLDLRLFPAGVTDANIQDFLSGVDIYLDGLDFFALEARRLVFASCNQLHIPAITVAPLGMSAGLINFLPGRMSFEEYFRLEGCSAFDQYVRLLAGLAPALLHRTYLADPTRVDLAARRVPSTAMACHLCAGIAATQALKIMLGRGVVRAAPHGLQFDAYRNRLVRTWRPGGNNNPLQRLLIALIRRRINVPAKAA